MSDLRNPWHGISAWRELKYDARHPVIWIRNVLANVNGVPSEQRAVSWGIVVVGLLSMILGLVIVVFG
jgi:hypothetical protein